MRKWLENQNLEIADGNVTLLKDVAETLEHVVLARELHRNAVPVEEILVIDRIAGADQGGREASRQVWIAARKRRPLGTVLLSVASLWKLALKLD